MSKETMILIHFFQFLRGRDSGQLGNFLFVSGAGLLSFSSVCLMRRAEFYLQIQDTAIILFALSAGMILAGESMRALSRRGAERVFPRIMDGQKPCRLRGAGKKIIIETRCFFCGKSDVVPRMSKKSAGKSFGRNGFVRCMSCGKTVCVRCSYLKGKEMNRDSLRCPGCGGQMY